MVSLVTQKRTIGILLVLTLAAVMHAQIPAQRIQVDQSRLESVEDMSESFANDMLELSLAVRSRDLERMTDFFADPLRSEPFPSEPTESRPGVKWIENHAWIHPSAPGVHHQGTSLTARGRIARRHFLSGWARFLDHFSAVEDARFKVKQASFENPEAPATQARLAFYVIGRDRHGRREWARGTAQVAARKAGAEPWRIESFELVSFESMLATKDLFSEVAAATGIEATAPPYGTTDNSGFVWHGAAAGDLNGDGFVDLAVTGAKRNYIYLNDGRGKFREVARQSGLEILPGPGTQPLLLDYDNDGDLDLFISAVGSQFLFQSRLAPDGKLEFRDVSVEAHVDVSAIGFSASAADANGDGYPDIYVACYNRYGLTTPDSWFRATNGTPNLLFINQKDGTFREDAARWGVADRRWSYSAVFADVNGDGRQDLYVANDFGENALFVNKGDRFVDEAGERGVLDPGNGMGAAIGDFNNDGRLDLHTTNMSSTAGNRILARLFPQSSAKDNVLLKLASGNDLFENAGDGYYRSVTSEAGEFGGGWAWGGGFIDFDNDGWEDLYTPNGFISGKSMKDT